MKALSRSAIVLVTLASLTASSQQVFAKATDTCEQECSPPEITIPLECITAGYKYLKGNPSGTQLSRRHTNLSYTFYAFIILKRYDQVAALVETVQDEETKLEMLQLAVSDHVLTHFKDQPEETAALLEKTLQLSSSLKQADLRVRLLLLIAEAHRQQQHFAEAASILDQAVETLRKIQYPENILDLNAGIIKIYAGIGKFDQAITLTKKLREDDRGEALSSIAEEYAVAQKFNEALEISEQIQDPYYQAYAFLKVAENLIKAGKKEQAETLLNRILQLSKKFDDEKTQVNLAGEVAAQFAVLENHEKALQIVRSIYLDHQWNDTSELADYYLKSKQYDRVMQVVQLLQELKDEEQAEYILTRLAKAYTNDAEFDQTLKTAQLLKLPAFKGSQASSYSSDAEFRSGRLGVLTHLAVQYAKAGQRQKSVTLFNSLIREAEKIAHPVELLEVGESYYEAFKDQTRAAKIFDLALQKSSQKPYQESRNLVLSALVYSYSLIGQYQQAIQIANQMKEYKFGGVFDHSAALNQISLYLISDRKPEQAFQVAKTIKRVEERDTAFSTIAMQIANSQKYDEALDVAKMIQDQGERDRLTATFKCAKGKQ